MGTNGLFYTDQRVLIALGILTQDRDQETNPITHAAISSYALVSLRTVQNCLPRLKEAKLIAMIGGGRGKSPTYQILDDGLKILEAHR